MNLEDIMVSERSQAQKDKLHDLTPVESKTVELIKAGGCEVIGR
jgi:hypothetical protein